MSKWLPLIGIIGLLCLGIGVYSVTQSRTATKTLIINEGLLRREVSVPFASYREARFSSQPELNNRLHLPGSGTLVYTFNYLNPRDGHIRVIISFSHSSSRAGDSTVTLLVNGQPAEPGSHATKIAPNGDVEWVAEAGLFKSGNNTLSFELQMVSGERVAVDKDLLIILPEEKAR